MSYLLILSHKTGGAISNNTDCTLSIFSIHVIAILGNKTPSQQPADASNKEPPAGVCVN